jgi:hypothetical protein
MCAFSLRYPTCNAHALYCHLWPDPLYNILPHYLKNGTVLEKKITINKMCVLTFPTTFDSNISHSMKWAIYTKNLYVGLHVKYPSFASDFNETFSRQIFENCPDIKFHENPPSGSWVITFGRTDGQTDRHDETSSCVCALKLIGFIVYMKGVYCAVRTGSLTVTLCASSLKGQ